MTEPAPVDADTSNSRPGPRALARLRASPWWQPLVEGTAVFAFSRIAILLVTGWSLILDPRLHRGGGHLQWPALQGLCWWDCGWYTRIAMDGYAQPQYSNFFPLFPLLGRGLHELTGLPIPIALVVIANLFGLVGLVVVYRLFRELEGEAVARTGIALMAAWPFSFFQAAGFPESMMVASTALAVWFAYRSRHLAAGTALGIGVLARHLTIAGGAALLVAQLQERGWRPRRFLFHRDFLGLLLPFAIAGLYLLYLTIHFGDPMAWWRVRTEGWGAYASSGVVTFFKGSGWEPQIAIYLWLSLIPGVAVAALTRKRTWWILAAFGAAYLVAIWSIGLFGLGRFTQGCWPAFLPMAALLEKRPVWKMPVLLAFALLQGMFLYLYAHSYPIN